MSQSFLLWESPKPFYSQNQTALEILHNYAKVNLKEPEAKTARNKSVGKPNFNCVYEQGGILGYDVKGEVIQGIPVPEKLQEPNIPPIIEITESSNIYFRHIHVLTK